MTGQRHIAFFSVLNARGLDLTATDILKADIIGEIPSNEVEQYTKIWDDLETDELGREGFGDLFGHLYMILKKIKPEGSLEDAFQKGMRDKEIPSGKQFIEECLVPYAEAYRIVKNADYSDNEYGSRVNQYLRSLDMVSRTVSFWVAPAMEFYLKHNEDGERFFQLIKDLERLTYGLLFQPMNRDSRRSRYERILEVFGNSDNTIDEDTNALQLSIAEKSNIVARLNEPEPQTRENLKALLLKLDSLLADKGASYEHKVLTIEHVMPQNPEEDSQWLKDFPDRDARERWTGRLANLVLLSRNRNSRAQNYDFVQKKAEYFQKNGVTTFAITTDVVNESEWTPTVLSQRQQKLINLLKDEWRLA